MIITFEDLGTFQLCSPLSLGGIKNVILYETMCNIFLPVPLLKHSIAQLSWTLACMEDHGLGGFKAQNIYPSCTRKIQKTALVSCLPWETKAVFHRLLTVNRKSYYNPYKNALPDVSFLYKL